MRELEDLGTVRECEGTVRKCGSARVREWVVKKRVLATDEHR